MSAFYHHRLVYDSSWIEGYTYLQLFGSMEYPERRYRLYSKNLTARDQFIYDFCKRADDLKHSLFPVDIIQERITLPISSELTNMLARDLWHLSHRDEAFRDQVYQEITTTISVIMRLFWTEKLPSNLREVLTLNIPMAGQLQGVTEGVNLTFCRPSRMIYDRQFFGINAPVVLKEQDRGGIHEDFRELFEFVQLDALAELDLPEVKTSVVTEVASEISWSTGASPRASRNAASWLLSQGADSYDPENSRQVLRDVMTDRMSRRKLGAMLYTRLFVVEFSSPEMWSEITRHFFGVPLMED